MVVDEPVMQRDSIGGKGNLTSGSGVSRYDQSLAQPVESTLPWMAGQKSDLRRILVLVKVELESTLEVRRCRV
jgi:hypothetical protein